MAQVLYSEEVGVLDTAKTDGFQNSIMPVEMERVLVGYDPYTNCPIYDDFSVSDDFRDDFEGARD
jgi:hypothetical protein